MSMADTLQLERLKQRLTKLGVQIRKGTQETQSTDNHRIDKVQHSYQDRYPETAIPKNKEDVLNILDRCDAIETQLHIDERRHHTKGARQEAVGTSSGKERLSSKTKAVQPKKHAPARSFSPLPVRQSQRMLVGHTPLSSLIAQHRETEAVWQQEKAKLQRELLLERQRGAKLDEGQRRLAAVCESAAMEAHALKVALEEREAQLAGAYAHMKSLEMEVARLSAEKGSCASRLGAEVEELRALLLATMSRLEERSEAAQQAQQRAEALQLQVRELEEERASAIDVARAAQADAAAMALSRDHLHFQSQLLEKMSEVQLRHNMRKSAAIQRLLSEREARPGPHRSLSTRELEDEKASMLEDLRSAFCIDS